MNLYFFSVAAVFFLIGCKEQINPKNENKISVFPNPASDYIEISSRSNSNPIHCEIKILDGKSTDNIFTGDVKQINVKVDVSKYKSQSVLVQILMDATLEEHLVIIER